jgi:hypothetical protein
MTYDAALPQDDDLDLDLDDELFEEEENYDELVPGLPSLLLGLARPKPYPINIYNLDGRKESGIAGTLEPDGRFRPLPGRNLPRLSEGFDEQVKAKVPHTVVWDSVVSGCVEFITDPDEPLLRRTCDGSVTGPWPVNPPKPERLVSVEKARLAAEENESELRQLRGNVL